MTPTLLTPKHFSTLETRRVPFWGKHVVGYFLWGPLLLGVVAYLMGKTSAAVFAPYVWAAVLIWSCFVFRWAGAPSYVHARASHVLVDWMSAYPDLAPQAKPTIQALAMQDPSIPWLWIVDLEIAAKKDLQSKRLDNLRDISPKNQKPD